ncbi:UPF0149 family protein [Utexia brackfieldae]|uniref:UPF0149 family protein n=1 Tax=Utexia brackfieldae TaxID=3074108 RepID=UPI00370D6B2F
MPISEMNYQLLNNTLKLQQIGLTAAELHGFISGLLAGGNRDETWRVLLADMINDGQPITGDLASQINKLHDDINQQLNESEFEFQLLLDEQNIFMQIDSLVGWVNHFLLGLGLVQPQLAKVKNDVGEAISDLRQIALLGYEEDEDPQELGFAFEEVHEYVRMATILCHDEFAGVKVSSTLH